MENIEVSEWGVFPIPKATPKATPTATPKITPTCSHTRTIGGGTNPGNWGWKCLDCGYWETAQGKRNF